MADIRPVDVALQPRPALPEVVGVVLACALVFLALVKIDGSAARDRADRARAALAEPPSRATSGGPPETLLALFAGAGVMMALAGTVLLTRR